MPLTYIVLFLLGAVQTLVLFSLDKTGKLQGIYDQQAMISDAVSFGGVFVLVPLFIVVLRYFTRAEPTYPPGLFFFCLRLIGWTIALRSSRRAPSF
ncbi:hypothetical protein IZ6_10190 [Terrihabitans soli]|uniref:Uncharacterized protein n=2 Tax=Terrihabitans soli TaxID=708113 RepID=A0A6S6QJ47_9HYPH|nr:hypothetical protein IZ6_10190 [Terrihabitans soli]